MLNSEWSSESLYNKVQAVISGAPNPYTIFVILGTFHLFLRYALLNQFLCYPSLLSLIIYLLRAMLRANSILIHDLFASMWH